MKERTAPKNISASVRARLFNLSQENKTTFQSVIENYFRERFLYRLSQSSEKNHFILKGGSLFVMWGLSHRETRDIDFLGFGAPDPENIHEKFKSILSTDSKDGVLFHLDSLKIEPRREDKEYQGVRVFLSCSLDTIRTTLHMDVGFGDKVTPSPTFENYPVLLPEMPQPFILSYPRETVIAEKLHAALELGQANSRMKDFFDIFYLLQHSSFEGKNLCEAIKNTFERRRTPLPLGTPTALTSSFANEKQNQWNAWIEKNKRISTLTSFTEIINEIASFSLPALTAARGDEPWLAQWRAGERGWYVRGAPDVDAASGAEGAPDG